MAHHLDRATSAPDRRARPWLCALSLATLLALGTVGTLVAHADGGTGASTAGATASSSQPDAATLQHAEGLYLDTCASCHGRHGQGAGMPGMELPALDASGVTWQKTDAELEMIVKNGAGLMPGVGASWTKDDIRAVLALVRTWWTPEQLHKHESLSTKTP